MLTGNESHASKIGCDKFTFKMPNYKNAQKRGYFCVSKSLTYKLKNLNLQTQLAACQKLHQTQVLPQFMLRNFHKKLLVSITNV